LSNSSELGFGVSADLSDNLWVNWTEEIRSKEFNHIVEDEKKELLLVFTVMFGNLWKNSGNELLNKFSAMRLVGLENDTENLSKSNLELIFIFVFFLENCKIFLIELVILITFKVLLLVFGVVLNSVLRLLNEIKDFL